MKTYEEFITEAMEHGVSMNIEVTCTAEELKASIPRGWLSVKLDGTTAKFFGPEHDIERWLSKNAHWVK
jgi:hypothetical protein